MNRKLLTFALCAFLNISVWACDSDNELDTEFNDEFNDEFDTELAGINNEANLAQIALLSDRLSRCSTGFTSASTNENCSAVIIDSRTQSSVVPSHFSSDDMRKIQEKKSNHIRRQRLGSITNTTQMDTINTSKKRNGSTSTPVLEVKDDENVNMKPVKITPRPETKHGTPTYSGRRSASRLANFDNLRSYNNENDENISQEIKRK